jgi:RPA family protein
MDPKRIPSVRVSITDIINGKFFSGSREEMMPSYVITPFGKKVARVSVVATAVEVFSGEEGKYHFISVDDGTGLIRIKAFGEDTKLLEGIKAGDLVLIIGKVKEYNGETYVSCEIAKKVEPNYENLRKIEILNDLIEQKKVVDEIKKLVGKMSEEELKEYALEKFCMDEESLKVVRGQIESKEKDYKPVLMDMITKLDDGKGVEIKKLLEESKLPEHALEEAMNELLANGELFEPRPGILKKI